MKKFCFKVFCLMPLLLMVAVVNYGVDPNHLFHPGFLDQMAQALSNHQSVKFSSEFDYCLLQKKLIEKLPQAPDMAILGLAGPLKSRQTTFQDRGSSTQHFPTVISRRWWP